MKDKMRAGVLGICLLVLAGAGPWALPGGEALAAEVDLRAPQEGNLLERVHKLWAQTLPLVEADLAAGRDDAWYQARRTPIFGAWVRLQALPEEKSGVPPQTREGLARLIPRILELVDHVYGFPGFTQAKREANRANQGRARFIIKDIEKKLAAIK